MNIVIEYVAVNKAMEICEKDKQIHVQPTINGDGTLRNDVVDVIINGACSIKQCVEYHTLEIVTKFGHIINIKYSDYYVIKIL
jgi:hypothetical protein